MSRRPKLQGKVIFEARDVNTRAARQMDMIARRMESREKFVWNMLKGDTSSEEWVPVLRRVAQRLYEKHLKSREKSGENGERETST